MDTVDQKLDEVLNGLAYEKIVGGAPKSESDPLLAKLKSAWWESIFLYPCPSPIIHLEVGKDLYLVTNICMD